jgi:hypothetical protein
VPSNLAAKDAGGGVGQQGYPCNTQYGCADGFICNSAGSTGVCGAFCCNNADCVLGTGLTGLTCVISHYAGDAGVADGSASGQFGVCK